MKSNHIRNIVIIFGLVIIGGCGSTPVKMSQQDSSSIRSDKLTVIQYESAFVPMTNTKAAFAALGALSAISEGKKLVKEMNLENPSVVITTRLSEKLKAQHHFKSVEMKELDVAYKKNAEDVSKLSGNEGYILDILTMNWGTQSYPFTHRYRASYMADLRFIDAKNKRVLSQERCYYDEKKSDNSPSYDELMADNGKLLKEKFELVANHCTQKFADALGISAN